MISKPTREDFVELYLCRAALEQLVAERAALEATPADIETMTLALRRSEEAINRNDLLAVLTHNTQFHDKMVQSARIVQLSRLMDSIRSPILLARRMVLAAGEVNERGILAEHWEILLAIQERNSRLTQDGMKRHMHNDLERGLAQFDSWERSYDKLE